MTKSQRNGTLCKINETQEKEPMAGVVIAMFTTVLRVIERRFLIWVCLLGTQTVPYTLSMVSREVLNLRVCVGPPITSTTFLVIRREFLNLSVFWETDKHPFSEYAIHKLKLQLGTRGHFIEVTSWLERRTLCSWRMFSFKTAADFKQRKLEA